MSNTTLSSQAAAPDPLWFLTQDERAKLKSGILRCAEPELEYTTPVVSSNAPPSPPVSVQTQSTHYPFVQEPVESNLRDAHSDVARQDTRQRAPRACSLCHQQKRKCIGTIPGCERCEQLQQVCTEWIKCQSCCDLKYDCSGYPDCTHCATKCVTCIMPLRRSRGAGVKVE